MESTTRRKFIKSTAASVAALTVLPARTIAGLGHTAPSDKLNIAAIGVGGVGFRNINNLAENNIVALCDVDWVFAEKAFRRWTLAKRYTDFRMLFDQQNDIDAVVVATPDHTHAVAAIAAMQLQKHVFVQSPMAHSVFEGKRMTELAGTFDIVSQVGNSLASSDDVRTICELLWSGAIGEVREAHAWTSSPEWKQGYRLPDKKHRTPKELEWDTFVGPSKYIDYNPMFTPFGWRAWYNFGAGALGDAAPNIIEPVFSALHLTAPSKVEASPSWGSLDTIPASQKIVFEFDRRDNLPKLALPELKLTWYDGGMKPERPADLPGDVLMGDLNGGLLLIGDDGILVCGINGNKPMIYKKGELIEFSPERKLHRIANAFNGGHEADWVRSCKESSNNRLQASASFETQQALTETICVGTMAVRLHSLNKKLEWDSAQMSFTNIGQSEKIVVKSEGELVFENNISKFKISENRFNARQFVETTVRPIYRDGWQQV